MYESIKASVADSIPNLQLKHSWVLSGQNIYQFNKEQMENMLSSLF